jgi:hypothetical protein
MRETSSVGARRCRGRDDHGTCPPDRNKVALKKMLECSVCLCVIYKLQREVLEIRRYLTGSGKDVFGAWMLLRLGLSS